MCYDETGRGLDCRQQACPGEEIVMKVLNFAQAIDESARLFYEEMAARADNVGVKAIFRKLAEDEEALLNYHRVLAIRGDIPDSETLDEGMNMFEHLRRQEESLQVGDDVSAYRLALDAERDLTKMYWRAAHTEANPEVRELIASIAQNEQQHMEELEALYEFTNAPNTYLAWGEFSNLGEFHNFGRDMA
jgi:rubrerythrin